MRIIGLILAMLGGFALCYQGFNFSQPASTERQSPHTDDVFGIPLVVDGIVVVSGLLLLASGGRRVDD